MKTLPSKRARFGVLAGLLALGLGTPAVADPSPGACPNRRPYDHIGNFNFMVEISGVNAGFFMSLDVGPVVGVPPAKAAAALRSGAPRIALRGGKGEGFALWPTPGVQTIPELVVEAVDEKGESVSRSRLLGCVARVEGDTLQLSNCRTP